MQVTIDIDGLERLGVKLDEVLDPVRGVVVELTEYAQLATRRGAKPHPVDLGKLGTGDNIRHSVSPAGTPVGQLEGKVYSNSPIVFEVDQGRPPGGRMPPIKAMASWAGRHGIPEDRAFYLARAIGRRGTQPVEFFQQALDSTEDVADRATGAAAREIEQRWGR
jgi:hypothetical protein